MFLIGFPEGLLNDTREIELSQKPRVEIPSSQEAEIGPILLQAAEVLIAGEAHDTSPIQKANIRAVSVREKCSGKQK
jgi:hypothetical protein